MLIASFSRHYKPLKGIGLALKVNKYGDSQTYYGSVITTLQRLKIVPEGSQVPTRTAEPVGTGREGEREREITSLQLLATAPCLTLTLVAFCANQPLASTSQPKNNSTFTLNLHFTVLKVPFIPKYISNCAYLELLLTPGMSYRVV